MNLTQDQPTPRDLVDRARVLANVMVEHYDVGPNYVLLLILADQLRMLCETFEDAEIRQIRSEKLPE